MTTLIGEIEQDVNKYKGQSILNIVENMKQECIEKVVTDFVLHGIRLKMMLCMRQCIIEMERSRMRVQLKRQQILPVTKKYRREQFQNLNIIQ